MVNLVWLQGGGCTGDSMSFLNADHPNVVEAITKLGVNVAFHPTISPQTGDAAMAVLEKFAKGGKRLDILAVEGSVALGPNNTGNYSTVGGRSFKSLLKELTEVAQITVAVGTCASFGGIPATPPNPTNATGLQFQKRKKGGFLGADYRAKSGLPVINISGCPAHPDWVLHTLAAVLLGKGDLIQLDEYQRPCEFYSVATHEGCSRNEYFDYKMSAIEPGEDGCLHTYLGCKGPFVFADCNIRLWNRQSSCTRVGAPCIGCAQPGFPEETSPFYEFTRLAVDGWRKIPYMVMTGLAKLACPKRLRNKIASSSVIKDSLHILSEEYHKLTRS
jgi:hydrogenase small subunit